MKHDLLFGIKCLCIVRLSVEHEYLISALEVFHADHDAPWQERNTLVESVCKTQLSGKTYSKEHLTNIIHIPELNLNWCMIPKVASTSLCKTFLPLITRNQPRKDKKWGYLQAEIADRSGAFKLFKRGELSLKSYNAVNHTFLIARHPFGRLASAFRNKIENRTKHADGEHFYRHRSSQIIKFTRGSWNPTNPEPTFEEFLEFIINNDPNKFDIHWKPISKLCSMCKIPFTHILKYENLIKEWPMFLSSTGLPFIDLPGGSTGSLRSYYSNISEDVIRKLYNIYVKDFKIFGYELNDKF